MSYDRRILVHMHMYTCMHVMCLKYVEEDRLECVIMSVSSRYTFHCDIPLSVKWPFL